MFADFDKVKAKGYIPLAIGGQQWQIGYLTHALALAQGGPTLFEGLYGANPDEAVLDSPEMKNLLDLIRKIQQNTDEGSTNRDWNVTTNLVITGKALMQLHGDWMKGEFAAAGKVAGTDFGCINIPGTKGLSLSIDAWGLLDGVDDAHKKAELDFAAVNVDPQIQNAFAKAKGSTPLRTDAPLDGIDQCSLAVIKALDDPERAVVPDAAQHRRLRLAQLHLGRDVQVLERPFDDHRSGHRAAEVELRIDPRLSRWSFKSAEAGATGPDDAARP